MLHFITRLLILSIALCIPLRRAAAQNTYVVQSPQVVQGSAIAQAPYVAGAYPSVYPTYVPVVRHDSIFQFGYRGMFAGALAGLGASYFSARHSGDAWQAVGISTGVGALSGAALGLSLGVLDRAGMDSAYYISRDLSYGVVFGTAVGAIGGGVMAIGGGDADYILYGAAGGSLAGVALGILTGIIEGQFRAPPMRTYARRGVRVSLARLGENREGYGAQVVGSF